MRQVRLALGPEALIVSNKRVNGGVEILATDQTSLSEESVQDLAAPASHVDAPDAAYRPVATGDQNLLGAIGELRGSLENRIDELLWGSQLRRAPQAVTLFQSLLRFGFSTALLRAMLKRLPDPCTTHAAFHWARNELVKHLPVLSSEDILWQPGLTLALVGPTGVGKTTTIAKLAARCVRRIGPDGLVLLTTDTYRIGAHEQLKIYGQMLRVPVYIVQDVHEIQSIVQNIRPDQTILIDNVGISQRDRYITEQAALLANTGREVKRLLVLNASSHGDTLDEVARSYANDGGTPLKGCIISKIDEASRLGAVLDTAIRYQLPIHYVSNGQKVPENLLFLSAIDLVDRALASTQTGRTLYAPTEADLAALLSITKVKVSDDKRIAAEALHQKALLPSLLPVPSRGGQALTMEDLRSAIGLLDEDPVLTEGYELWRNYASGSLPSAAEANNHLQCIAYNELIEAQAVRALVIHDRTSLQLGECRGTWHVSAWFDPIGRALAATTRQLGLADGWYTSVDTDSMGAPTAADALTLQVNGVAKDAPLPILHVLDGGGRFLWHSLTEQGCHWLAQCSAKTRVLGSNGAATLSAISQKFTYRLLEREDYPVLASVAGLERSNTVLWIGSGQVQLNTRSQMPLAVVALCLRIVDGRDGRQVHRRFALAHVPESIDVAALARALLLRGECHGALRQAAAILPVLTQSSQRSYPLLDQSLYAAQLGLAAWHLRQDLKLNQATQVSARMLGMDALLARHAHAGLMKLYTLKALLA